MSAAEGIREQGFRRWYERQLIEAHACLVTALLSTIMVAVCLDQFRWRDAGVKPMVMLALVIAGILLCVKMIAYYFKAMMRAEHLAAQSACPSCAAYGLLHVIGTGSAASSSSDDSANDWLKVRCRKCDHEWTMTFSPQPKENKKYL